MKKFVCSVCGYVHEGDAAPDKCPQCGAVAAKFNEQDANAEIEFKSNSEAGKQIRSMKNAKNLTANTDLSEINPVDDRVLVTLKSWPKQSASGIFMPDEYVIIRGEQYITEVHKVGKDITIVKEGDVAIMSMYSGFHVTTKTGHAKIISETDILAFKEKKEMEKVKSFKPETFKPGINYILVKVFEKKTVRSDSGLITEVGDDDAFSKNDVVTKTGEVLAIGPTNEYGKKFTTIKVGSKIIFDAYVGLQMNPAEVTDPSKYIVMYAADILGTIG